MNNLPDDILYIIFHKCNASSLIKLKFTNKYLRILINNETFDLSKSNNKILFTLIKHNNYFETRWLLMNNIELYYRSYGDNLCIAVASYYGCYEILKMLLDLNIPLANKKHNLGVELKVSKKNRHYKVYNLIKEHILRKKIIPQIDYLY